MPRKGKGFPEISSMPSFRIDPAEDSSNNSHAIENIPMRSIETHNLKNMPSTSSPFSTGSSEIVRNSAKWTPVYVSNESLDEDEKQDKVEESLRGNVLRSLLTSDNVSLIAVLSP